MRTLLLNILILLSVSSIFAQINVNKDEIKQKYESFEYADVIRAVDIFLYNNNETSKTDSIEVLTMKAISHYSLGEENAARSTFGQIILIEPEHKLDPITVSPKIIALFDELKNDFKPKQKQEISPKKNIFPQNFYSIKTDLYKNTFARSIVLPGWGHLYLESNTKGWFLTGLSTVALGSMIYFIADTHTKEQSYLNEINPRLINEKYDSYNSAYKTRNILIASYAIIWIYTQIDLLFNSEELFENKLKMSITTDANVNLPKTYKINVQYSLN